MLTTPTPGFQYAVGASDAAPVRNDRAARRATRVARTRLAWAAIAAVAAAAVILLGVNWSATPDGDPALHLRLIEDIARTHQLPTELPNLAARVGLGGVIQQSFPYSYTPLYHLVAAFAYELFGVAGVLWINVVAAGIIGFVISRFVSRKAPAGVAALAAVAAFSPPTVHAVFTEIFMEPMMLAFLFVGAWFLYLAMTTRKAPHAVLGGMFLGLAVATRQNALISVFVLGLLVCAHLFERKCWRMQRLRPELPWIGTLIAVAALAAGPSLLYLVHSYGSVGYGDMSLPGMHPTLAIDTVANEYVAGITKPDMSMFQWLDRYQRVLLFSDRWLPLGAAAVSMPLTVFGAMYLEARGGAGRFYARWVVVQLIAEIVVFVVLHGNARYIMLSQMLYFSLVPVGIFAAARAVHRWSRERAPATSLKWVTAGVIAAAVPLAIVSVVPVGYWEDHARTGLQWEPDSRELHSFRGDAYAEMGAWVNQNTPPDAMILTPRTYTAELTWEREVTWVTYYGNAWVVDAISSPDPAVAHAILAQYGIDYVAMQDPPGTYVDQIPASGMRSYLRMGMADSPYFTLVHVTESEEGFARQDSIAVNGVGLYRVEPMVGTAR